jgi:hypothetical protein
MNVAWYDHLSDPSDLAKQDTWGGVVNAWVS